METLKPFNELLKLPQEIIDNQKFVLKYKKSGEIDENLNEYIDKIEIIFIDKTKRDFYGLSAEFIHKHINKKLLAKNK